MAYLKRNPQRLSTTALGVIPNVIYTVSTFTLRAQDGTRPLLVTSYPSSKRTFFIQNIKTVLTMYEDEAPDKIVILSRT